MNDIAIRVENLSKVYRIGAHQRPWGTLRERLSGMLLSPFEYLRTALRPPSTEEIVWALKDVSFEVRRGEVIGIIGRNGAGKSTLLKILSRITEPTSGYADLYGRVGSLLEVGTGFHPELTGRENVYMNGAILGMRKAEIDRKFDEIVDFAGVEKFIDTPVKRYSSGMYVRLAFAVAAHLETEILLVDEVLAVGDAEFQKKCLGKMGRVAQEGRTVLFVSHNMGAISQLCPRTILLQSGQLVLDGETKKTLRYYLESEEATTSRAFFENDPQKPVQFNSIVLKQNNNLVNGYVKLGEPIDIEIIYSIRKWPPSTYIALLLTNEIGTNLVWSNDADKIEDLAQVRTPGNYLAHVRIPGNVLSSGKFFCSIGFYSPAIRKSFDYKQDVVSFEVVDTDSLLAHLGIPNPAVTGIKLVWKTSLLRNN